MRGGRIRGGAAAIAASAVVALAACGQTASDPPPDHIEISDGPSAGPSAEPQTLAAKLLAAIVLPDGARVVTRSPDPLLDRPAEQPVCTPLVDEHEWAMVDDQSPARLQTWLQQAQPGALQLDGSGSLTSSGAVELSTISGKWTGDYPDFAEGPETVISIVASGGGSALRADVEIAPAGAGCAHSGSGAGAQSGSG